MGINKNYILLLMSLMGLFNRNNLNRESVLKRNQFLELLLIILERNRK
jgi:hypothetical protein